MNRLLLLAWPGALATTVSRLLDTNRLPHLHRLVERGAIADLRRDCPGPAALTWATVATGCRADAHGILGDLRPRPSGNGVRWTGSGDWRAPAIWQYLDAAGAPTSVVNWPATHPAGELARGTLVSPAFLYAPTGDPEGWLLPPDAVWPVSAREELAKLRLHASELKLAEAESLVPGAATIDQDTDPRLAKMLISLATNASAHAVATHLAESRQPDLLAVHFDLLVNANEVAEGSRTPPSYARTPDATLEFYDLMLGRYLELLGEEVSVLIVSAGWRGVAGVMVAAGPAVRGDVRTAPCTTLDILPIALRLMSLATPAHLPGRAPVEMWRDTVSKLAPAPTLAPPGEEPALSPTDHLTAVGYKPVVVPLLAEWATRQRAADLAQLSRLKLSTGDAATAVALAEQAVQLQPVPPWIELLARAAFLAKDLPRAAAATDRLLSVDSTSPAGHLLKALLDHGAGEPSSSALPADKPLEQLYSGVLAMMRGETAAGMTLLRQAADALPHDAGVQHAFGLALRSTGELREAIAVLARAAALSPRPATVLVHYAQTLERTGDYAAAEAALRRALILDPSQPALRTHLDSLLRRRLLHDTAPPRSQ